MNTKKKKFPPLHLRTKSKIVLHNLPHQISETLLSPPLPLPSSPVERLKFLAALPNNLLHLINLTIIVQGCAFLFHFVPVNSKICFI